MTDRFHLDIPSPFDVCGPLVQRLYPQIRVVNLVRHVLENAPPLIYTSSPPR